ncbi:MAG: nitroreductase family protein [Saprospiraceae bacterium]|nr:nitroreductase family protein [Lewinella sp.]
MTTLAKNKQKAASTNHSLHPHITARWSPRVFSGQEITEEDIHHLLEAARWAPSSRNEQPWRFIYAFRGSEAYDNIFQCLSEFNQQWVRNAPVLMLTAYKEQFDSGIDNFHASHDLGLAVGIMSMQAQSMGIALHQMAGVNWREAQAIFEVPEGYHITTAIAVGYYGGDPDELPENLRKSELAERNRVPLAQFAVEGEWPEKSK